MLYIIGLGLNDEKDITVKGLEAIKSCQHIYLEDYTSLLQTTKQTLEKFYNKPITLADRNLVEKETQQILDKAKTENTALLVIGDPMGATTHTDLILRAKKQNIEVQIIHNTSILNAVGATGLQLYKFGKTTSIVFPEENWLPETLYNVIKQNQSINAHTLCLLDIKKDQNKFMTVKEAIETLLKIENKRKESVFTEETQCIGIARIGNKNQIIKTGTAKQLKEIDFQQPPHSLIIPGKLHFMEEEFLKQFQ